jgi:hypothetical protein
MLYVVLATGGPGETGAEDRFFQAQKQAQSFLLGSRILRNPFNHSVKIGPRSSGQIHCHRVASALIGYLYREVQINGGIHAFRAEQRHALHRDRASGQPHAAPR